MLTGHRPFDADNRERLFYEICNEEAAPLAAVRPTLPEDAARIVAKALEKDRNRRYQHTSEICSDLRRLKRGLESIKTVIVPDAGDEPAIAPAGPLASAAKAQPASGKSSAATVLEQPEATARRLWKVVAVVGAVALAGILVVVGFTSWYAQQQTARQPELSRRQLTTNSSEVPVSAAAISPDGKYLAYADDTGIYVRVIETGERHLLSTAVSGFATSKLSWFPDGIRLVASGTAAGETAPSIWALSILRGAPLKLRADARGASVSPNGSQIAFLNGNATEIWLMGGNGEEPQRFVAADEGYFLLALAWFPDSERLGYLRRGHGETRSDVSILSRDLKESQSVAVFADPKLVAFCILSDGRLLVSRGVDGYTELNKARGDSAVRPLSFELWEIGTNPRTGQASGRPRRVSNWTGPPLTDLSATADGKRLAYLEGPAQYDVYTAELEGNGLRLKPPRRLTLDDSLDIPSAWTPDGKEILFVSDRDGTFDIFKQAIDQRTAEAIVVGPGDESDPIVSSDGAWILYFDDPVHRRNISTEPVTLRRVPVSGGPSQVVLKEPGLYLIGCTGSKAKAKLCVMDKRVGDELIFYAFDPVQGMGRELARIHAPNIRHYWRLSPDGSSIAMPTRERGGGIRIVSLTGKPSRGIFVNEPVDHVLWSADGRGFYATTVDTNLVPWAVAGGSLQKLLYIDLDGHTQTLWRSGNFAGVYGLPSPDGRYLALGMGRMLGNAWMVENF
jgi:Tol biopolymer transport system component